MHSICLQVLSPTSILQPLCRLHKNDIVKPTSSVLDLELDKSHCRTNSSNQSLSRWKETSHNCTSIHKSDRTLFYWNQEFDGCSMQQAIYKKACLRPGSHWILCWCCSGGRVVGRNSDNKFIASRDDISKGHKRGLHSSNISCVLSTGKYL